MSEAHPGTGRPDLDSPEHIRIFVEAFYEGMLADSILGPIFLDVAAIELDQHLPLIRAYWEKLLLGSREYRRHTMNIHRELAAQRSLQKVDFERWLTFFVTTMDRLFSGPMADRAKQLATNIAINMHNTLHPEAPVETIEPIAELRFPPLALPALRALGPAVLPPRPPARRCPLRLALSLTRQREPRGRNRERIGQLRMVTAAIEPLSTVADTRALPWARPLRRPGHDGRSILAAGGVAMAAQPEVLSQPFELGFTYTRSTGPVVGRFLTELRQRRVVGIRGSDGRVLMPPVEFDPVTAEALSEFVPVDDQGTVTSWSWVSQPLSKHPFQHPFGWGLIVLDGADPPLLHCIDAGHVDAMRTGMRVRARWADEPAGHIRDILCFEPVEEIA